MSPLCCRPIEAWDVSKITDMDRLFKAASNIPDIGAWDVSQVTDFVSFWLTIDAYNAYT